MSSGWSTGFHATTWPVTMVLVVCFSSQFASTSFISTTDARRIVPMDVDASGGINFGSIGSTPLSQYGRSCIIYERISTLNKEQIVLTCLTKYPHMNPDAELSGSKCSPGISPS